MAVAGGDGDGDEDADADDDDDAAAAVAQATTTEAAAARARDEAAGTGGFSVMAAGTTAAPPVEQRRARRARVRAQDPALLATSTTFAGVSVCADLPIPRALAIVVAAWACGAAGRTGGCAAYDLSRRPKRR